MALPARGNAATQWRNYLRLTLHCEFPISKIYWARTRKQNTRQSMRRLCGRRAYLSEGAGRCRMALRELPGSHPALRIAAASCALASRDEEAKRLIDETLGFAAGADRTPSGINGALSPPRPRLCAPSKWHL